MCSKLLIVLSVLLVATQAVQLITNYAEPRVCRPYGMVSAETAKDGEFPFLVTIHSENLPSTYDVNSTGTGKKHSLHCGGTIIGRKWVLTAAYCIDIIPRDVMMLVKAGPHSSNDVVDVTEEMTVVNDRFVHEYWEFNRTWVCGKLVYRHRHPYNIGLLKLNVSLSFTKDVRPILFPRESSMPSGLATFASWDTDGDSDGDYVLQKTHYYIIENDLCSFVLDEINIIYQVDETNICSLQLPGDKLTRRTHDAGNPLIVKNFAGDYEIVGVASTFEYLGPWRTQPYAYANVLLYIDWIQDKIDSDQSVELTTKYQEPKPKPKPKPKQQTIIHDELR